MKAVEARLAQATKAMVLAGVALRFVQWFGNASLWRDEVSLVHNVLERSPVELVTRGLDGGQVAPVGFLALEKAAVLVFGDADLVHRIVPLAASIAALVLFVLVARELLRPLGVLVATACLALNPLLISLSAVVKQYSTDVLVTVLLFLAVRRLWTDRGSLRSRILVGVGAGALGFFSIPSAMVAGAAMISLAHQGWATRAVRSPSERASVLLPLLCWGGIAGGAALWANLLLTPSMHDSMRVLWMRDGAFAPPFFEYPTWVLHRTGTELLSGLFLRPYMNPPIAPDRVLIVLESLPGVALIIGVVVWVLTRRHGIGLGAALVVVVPLFFSVGLSRLQIYPLSQRTSVFLLPLLVLLVGASADAFAAIIPDRVRLLRLTIPIAVISVLGALLLDHHPVYNVQRTREIIQELSDRREVDQPVFVYGGAWSDLRYYGPRLGVTDGLHMRRNDGDVRGLLTQLDTFRGERSLWVLFTLVDPSVRDLVLCYLDEIGTVTEQVVLSGGLPIPVSLHRYDLSTLERWVNANPLTFPSLLEAFQGTPPRCRRTRTAG